MHVKLGRFSVLGSIGCYCTFVLGGFDRAQVFRSDGYLPSGFLGELPGAGPLMGDYQVMLRLQETLREPIM